jgi:hypothetical protein
MSPNGHTSAEHDAAAVTAVCSFSVLIDVDKQCCANEHDHVECDDRIFNRVFPRSNVVIGAVIIPRDDIACVFIGSRRCANERLGEVKQQEASRKTKNCADIRQISKNCFPISILRELRIFASHLPGE